MTSHFSTIGLPISSQQEIESVINQVIDRAEVFKTDQGQYRCWRSETGAELWMQIDRENNLTGLNPHFRGESRVRVGLAHTVTRPEDTPLDGAFYAWADPAEDTPLDGAYPFVFDLPDFRLYPQFGLPVTATAQVAAFAHELSVYDTPEEFLAGQKGDFKLAPQSFIPSGLFTAETDASPAQQAHAIFTGKILRAEQKMNELTGTPFQWTLIETLGGTFDVVADSELVETDLNVGGIVSGSFWLSGRLIEYPRGRRGLLDRFFRN